MAEEKALHNLPDLDEDVLIRVQLIMKHGPPLPI